MTSMLSDVLGTLGWFSGLLVLLVMAALPLLEHLADPGGGRRTRPARAADDARPVRLAH